MSTSPRLISYLLYLTYRLKAAFWNALADLPPYVRIIFTTYGNRLQPSEADIFTARAIYPLDAIDHLDEVINADLERLTPLPRCSGTYRWQILNLDSSNQLHIEVVVLRTTASAAHADVRVENRTYHFGPKAQLTLWPRLSFILLIAIITLPPLKLQWMLHQRQSELDHQLSTLEHDQTPYSPHLRLQSLVTAQSRLNSAPSVLATLDQLSKTMPQEAWLLSLSIEDTETHLVGLAPSASEVLSSLSGNAAFQNISPQGATRIEGNMERFHMRVSVVREAPE